MTAAGEARSSLLWERCKSSLRATGQLVRTPAGLVRCVTLALLLPTPLWFALAVLLDDGPAWRAVYHEQPDFTGQQVPAAERRLSRYWDRQDGYVPGGFNRRRFSAVFDTCLQLREPRAIPFQLVVNGSASFSIDGQQRLRAGESKERAARGEVLQLAAGMHYLRVEFVGDDWASIALNASLDGRAPVAVPPERASAGVTWSQPVAGSEPCVR
jgi:hypothetical protein